MYRERSCEGKTVSIAKISYVQRAVLIRVGVHDDG